MFTYTLREIACMVLVMFGLTCAALAVLVHAYERPEATPERLYNDCLEFSDATPEAVVTCTSLTLSVYPEAKL